MGRLTGVLKASVASKLESAGISINANPFGLRINNDRMFSRILLGGSLAVGESYVDGDWDCDDLAGLMDHVLATHLNADFKSLPGAFMSLGRLMHNAQSIRGAKKVADVHYNLGNELYAPMLGRTMAYTCGYWSAARSLDAAQDAKFELVCKKLNLSRGQRILDIGCGFGSFAKYAAQHYGVEVVGVTIAEEQVAFGNDFCKGSSVSLRLMDYRKMDPQFMGTFDHVVSLGMFEHVGPANYRLYMQIARRMLRPDGLFLLHTIGGGDGKGGAEPWMVKYIFPAGYLPTENQIMNATHGLFRMEDWHNFGAGYDKTLCAWWENLDYAWEDGLKKANPKKYDERFYRTWRYYLLGMAGSFRSRTTQLWQIVLSPNGVRGGYRSVR